MAANEWAFEAYLNPPGVAAKDRRLFGVCERRDVAVVKAAGGRWHAESKRWFAADERTLVKLIDTRMWFPQGFPDPSAMRAYVQARLDAAQRAEVERIRAEQERLNAMMRAQHERAQAEQAEKARLEAASKAAFLRRDLAIPDDEPDDLRTLFEKHGIPPEHVALSATMSRLGPRAGISNAGRLLRAFTMGLGDGEGWLARELKLAHRLRYSAQKNGVGRSRAEAEMVRAWEAERAAGGPSQ